MNEDINALDEINKGCSMGIDAINYILGKVEDDKFSNFLQKQSDDYKKISNKIEKIYNNYNEGEPHETNVINKVMTWSGVNMKTLTDHSNSKIAELLLQGTNMGIIEGRKILNNKKLNEEVSNIIDEYVNMQEKCVETLKEYL